MIIPNKFVTYGESALGKVDKIYGLFDRNVSVSELYEKSQGVITSIDQFMYVLDILYLNDKIDINFDTGVVIKC